MATDPFVQINPLVAGMEQTRARRETTRENQTRLAKAYSRWTTTGLGDTVVEEVLEFGCTFIEEPAFHHGWSISEDEGPDLVLTDLPGVEAAVYRWQRDARGYYIGAWAFFTVTANETEYVLHHYLTFEGLAIKDLPVHLLGE